MRLFFFPDAFELYQSEEFSIEASGSLPLSAVSVTAPIMLAVVQQVHSEL